MVVEYFTWIGHHVLLRRFIIEGVVKNVDPLRVGVGRGAAFAPTDLMILKIAGKPVIPGSTWKGVFRATCYRLGLSRGIKNLCQGIPRAQCLKGTEFDVFEKGQYADEISEKIKAIIEGTAANVCLLCLMFGSPGFSSHVYFEDSFPTPKHSGIVRKCIKYRTCVAIDRRTGAASKRALYTIEYVEPGVEFNFRMVADNLPNYALGLLAEVFAEIQEGIVKVGGHKSRGFGTVRFEDLRVSVVPCGSGKGVVDGRLVALDPIDEDVEWPVEGCVAEGNDAWKVLRRLRDVWGKCSTRIAEISRNNWKWSIALKR